MPNPIRRRRLGRSGVFTVPERGSLQLWLRGDKGLYSDAALTTPATADGTAIGGWMDQSGLLHNATQATAGNRPVLKLAGINGMPAVLFTAASSQWLAANGAAAAFSGSNMPGTVMMAVMPVSTGTQIFFGFGNSGSAPPRWFFDLSAGNGWASVRESDGGSSVNILGGTNDTNGHVLTWVSPGTTMQINDNGVNAVGPSTQAVGTSTFNNATVGAINLNGSLSTFTNAYIAELFAWSTALSAVEQQTVRRYLEQKYRIAGT